MKKKKKTPLEADLEYEAFLRKRLASKNYKANVPAEEYAKTKDKHDRVKFRLKTLGAILIKD